MNKYVIFLFLLLSFLSVYSQTPSFKIEGKVNPRYNDSLVTLFTFTGSYIRSVDSTYVKEGHFAFEGSEYLYEESLISLGNYPDTVLVAELFLEQGSLEVELKPQSIVRSPYQTAYRQYKDSCSTLSKDIHAQGRSKEFYDAALERLFVYKFQFRKNYIHSGIGRKLLVYDMDGYLNDPYFYKLYDLLPERDKQRCDVKYVYEQRRRDDERQGLANKHYLDFTLINPAGEERKISDYVGKSKFLFLDFWASWCGPCLAQKPQIKELYEKYNKEGFEILGISLDEQERYWLASLKKSESLWPEFYTGGKERVAEFRKLYNITGIPSGVLIDQSGRIIHADCGYWQILKALLEAYYKK